MKGERAVDEIVPRLAAILEPSAGLGAVILEARPGRPARASARRVAVRVGVSAVDARRPRHHGRTS